MKILRTLLVIAFVAVGFASEANAQKVAHINRQEVMAALPETKALQDELQKLGETYGQEIQAADAALKAKLQKYEAESAAQSQEENQKRLQEVQSDQGKIQQLQRAAQEELQKKENEALAPIFEKVANAIRDVANEKGIVYVFDISMGNPIIYEKGMDITKDVLAKLGVTE